MPFHVAAGTVRGISHWRSHAPCQDAAVVGVGTASPHEGEPAGTCRQLVVGALADGGGSRVLSHVGARLAVSLAKSSMLTRWTAARFLAASKDELDIFWKDLIEDCRTLIAQEAARRSQRDPGSLACTLTTFMATRDRLAAAQVGDGFLVFARDAPSGSGAESNSRFDLLFHGRETDEASQVVWITAPEWITDYQHAVVDGGPFDMIVASSDGIANIVLAPTEPDPSRLQPHHRFFAKLEVQLQQEVKSSEAEDTEALNHRITEILSDPELDNWVDDDKSIALALWV